MATNDIRISTETVTKTYAEVVINGTSKGKREINGGPSLKEFVTTLAKEFGVRTFTVTVDGDSVTAASANAPVPAGSTVGIQAKDSRGSDESEEGAEAGEEEAEEEAEAEAEVAAGADTDENTD